MNESAIEIPISFHRLSQKKYIKKRLKMILQTLFYKKSIPVKIHMLCGCFEIFFIR